MVGDIIADLRATSPGIRTLGLELDHPGVGPGGSNELDGALQYPPPQLERRPGHRRRQNAAAAPQRNKLSHNGIGMLRLPTPGRTVTRVPGLSRSRRRMSEPPAILELRDLRVSLGGRRQWLRRAVPPVPAGLSGESQA